MRSRAPSPDPATEPVRTTLKRALVLLSLLAALGCTSRGRLPPTTSPIATFPVPVAVRFSRPGARLELRLPRKGPIVARCDADCNLLLLPARYDLRISGEGPDDRERLDVRGPSTVRVRVGNSAAVWLGAGPGLAGGLASMALPGALFHALICSESEPPSASDSRSCSRTTTTLALVGLSGVALAVVGIVVVHANETRIEVEQPATSAAPAPLFGDAQGIGFRF